MGYVTVYQYTPGKGFGPVKMWVPDKGVPAPPQHRAVQPSRNETPAQRAARQRREAMRAAEQVAAKRRREAAEALKKRTSEMLARLRAEGTDEKRQRLADDASNKVYGQEQAAQDEVSRTKKTVGDRRWRQFGETKTVRDQEHIAAMKNAVEGNKYLEEFSNIRKKQAETGGRYLDRELYQSLYDAYNKKVARVMGAWTHSDAHMRKLLALDKDGKPTRKLTLAEYKKAMWYQRTWQSRLDDAVKLKGNGRKPGEMAKVQNLIDLISSMNDDYLTRATMGYAAPGQTAAYDEAVSRFERERNQMVPVAPGVPVLRPVKLSLKEYLDKIDNEYRTKMENARGAFNARNNLLYAEGFDSKGKDATMRDRNVKATEDGARRLMHARGMTPEQIDKVFKDLYEGESVDRQRAFDTIHRVMMDDLIAKQAGDPRQHNLGIDRTKSSEALKGVMGQFASAQSSLDARLYGDLLGAKAPDNLERFLGGVGKLPVAGELMKGAMILQSGLLGLGRRAQLTAFGGRITTPDLQMSELWQGRFPIRWGEGNSFVTEHNNEVNAWDTLVREFNKAVSDGDPIKGLEALGAYGTLPVQGNLGQFATQAIVDPLNFIGPGRIVGAGRRALLDAGGLRALRSATSLEDFFRRFGSLVTDGRRLENANRLARVNTLLGTDFKKWGDVSQIYSEVLTQDLIKHPERMTKSVKGFARLWKIPEEDVRQILRSVTEKADELGTMFGGMTVKNEVKVASLIRRAQRSLEQGDIAIRGSVGKETRAMDIVEGRVALDTVQPNLTTTGTSLPTPPRPAQTRIDTTRAAVVTARKDYGEALKAVDNAARVLRNPKAGAKARGEAFTELEQALSVTDRFEGYLDPNTGKRTPGVLRRAESKLDKELSQAGLPGLGGAFKPSRTGSPKALATDIKAIDGMIVTARADLAAAVAGSPVAATARRQLRLLGAARRQMERERLRVGGQAAVAREARRRYGRQARSAIPRTRIAARHPSGAAVDEQFIRDLNRMRRSANVVGASPLNGVEESALKKAVNVLNKPLNRADARLSGYLSELPPGTTLWDALVITDLLQGNVAYAPLIKALYEIGTAELKGFRVQKILELERRVHYKDPFTLDMYRTMDQLIRKTFKARNRLQRKGVFDFRTRAPSGGFGGPAREATIADALDKIRVAERMGVSVYGYDEARQVFKGAELKRQTGQGLRIRAQARVAKGEDFDTAWNDELDKRVAYEADNDFERFAMQPMFAGKAPEDIWAVFVEHNTERDLIRSGLQLNTWQMDQLGDAIRKTANVTDPDDLAQIRRSLGGVVETPAGMRVPTQAELDAGLAGIRFPGPVFVAPDTHPHLIHGGVPAYAEHQSLAHARSGVWVGDGIYVGESNVSNPSVMLHEVGHALMHTEFGIRANAQWVHTIRGEAKLLAREINKVPGLASTVLVYIPTDLEEFMVELYGRWASGARPLVQVSPSTGVTEILTTWDDIRRLAGPGAAPLLDNLQDAFSRLVMPTPDDYAVRGYGAPPFWDRPRLYDWLVENGFWAKRTGEKIREGSRSWSYKEEKAFFEAEFGFTPPWADPAILKPLLDDPHAYNAAWEQWGVLDNGYEELAVRADLDSAAQKDALSLGTHEEAGLRKMRSPEEKRRYFMEKYGDLVYTNVQRPHRFHEVDLSKISDGPAPTSGSGAQLTAYRGPDGARALPKYVDAIKKGKMPVIAVQYERFLYQVAHDSYELLDPTQMAWLDAAYSLGQRVNVEVHWRTDNAGPSGLGSIGGRVYAPGEHVPLFTSESQLIAAPWLMDPLHQEYADFVARVGSENLPAGLMTPEQAKKFGPILAKVLQRRLTRYMEKTGLEHGDVWLSDELVRFGLDVTDELLRDKAWRGFWDERGRKTLYTVGQLQRYSVVLAVPFIVVNVLERLMFRVPLLIGRNPEIALDALRKGLRGMLGDENAMEAIPTLNRIGINLRGLWEMKSAGGWTAARDIGLRHPKAWKEVVKGLGDMPFAISSIGEDAMKIRFARTTYMHVRDELLKDGADKVVAEAVALQEARRLSLLNWPSLEDASEFTKAMNQIVPFLSYNWKTGMLFLDTAWSHPGVIIAVARMGDLLEKENREAWAELHGEEIPFPDKEARKLILRVGGFEYSIDFERYSDVLRAGQRLSKPSSAMDIFGSLVRIPHPQQLGMAALVLGGEAPWGAVEWTDFVWPAAAIKDTLDFLAGALDPETGKPLDFVEYLSELITWQRWTKLDPAAQGALAYYSLQRAGRYDAADRFLEEHPGVRMYLESRPETATKMRRDGTLSLGWFSHHSGEAAARFKDAVAGLHEIEAEFDRQIEKYYDTPWDPALKTLKMRRRATILTYRLDHPELFDAFAASMDFKDWAREAGEWLVDDMTDEFFALDAQWKPGRGQFPAGDRGELQYRKAYLDYQNQRDAWLDAHPLVEARLGVSYNDLQAAWKEQEASWGARLNQVNSLKIAVLEETLKGQEKQDRNLVSFLYDIIEGTYKALDFEAYAQVYAGADREFGKPGPTGLRGLVSGLGRVKTLKELPGFSDYLYDKATPEGKAKIEKTEAEVAQTKAYVDKMDRLMAGIDKLPKGDRGKAFYDRLRRDPELMAEYFRRNPEKKKDYELGQQYFHLISRWGRLMGASKFDEADRYWGSLPSWVKDRYYSNNPGKRLQHARTSAYLGAMGRWVSLSKHGKHGEADAFFRGLPTWMKERYFAKHPDQRYKFGFDSKLMAKAAAYFAADDVNKARMLKSDPVLRKFLAEHGTKSDDRMNMIVAGYQLITDPWLKRVYRERYPEVFSDAAKAAAADRRFKEKLRKHPELVDATMKAIAMQTSLFIEQNKLKGALPKPLEAVHLHAHRRRRHNIRNRAAGWGAHAASHRAERHGSAITRHGYADRA